MTRLYVPFVMLACAGCSGSSSNAQRDPADIEQPEGKASGSGNGSSCIEATEADREDPKRVPPKLGDATLDEAAATIKSTISRGNFLIDCAIDTSSVVRLCVAVRDGATYGVTVDVDPGTREQADCIADAIRKMSFPARKEIIVANMGFAQQPPSGAE